jgi:CheY-like chemotaxis protein
LPRLLSQAASLEKKSRLTEDESLSQCGFRYPRCEAMAKQQVKDEAKEKDQTQAKRILLVDDDYEIVESMRVALEAIGYEILVARDGNQGLAMAERDDPDLVILDMMMPKRSGFLVLEKIRRTRKVPMRVIMITANEGSRHKAYAEMLGVDDYIRKPFPMDRLIDSVRRLLG